MTNSDEADSHPLENKIRQLEQVNEILQHLLKAIHFDTLSPITTIAGFSKLLLTQEYGTLNENQQEFTERINSISQYLKGYTHEVLNISYALSAREDPSEKLNLKQFLNEGDWEIDLLEIDHAQEIWIQKHWLYPALKILFSIPHHNNILKRSAFCESSNEAEQVILHINHSLNQEYTINENDLRLQSLQIGVEQQGGFFNWAQLSENELEFELGLPTIEDHSGRRS